VVVGVAHGDGLAEVEAVYIDHMGEDFDDRPFVIRRPSRGVCLREALDAAQESASSDSKRFDQIVHGWDILRRSQMLASSGRPLYR
jgi:hypothetical protein